jgi:hypothetical protein
VQGSHGHRLLDNGNLLLFRARPKDGEPSPAHEYSFGLSSGMLLAQEQWFYVSEFNSDYLGDVDRLPNGNTLVTYASDSVMHELSPRQELVQSFVLPGGGQFGYSDFRETLYGPPQ